MDKRMKLSPNLTLGEVIRSGTATRHGISNMPTEAHLSNLKNLAQKVFQPIREHFGKPIFVSSGYRSKELNTRIGGSKSSHHMIGCALDLDQDDRGTGVSNKDVFEYIRNNLDFTQLIWEFGDEDNPAWVHVGLVPGQEGKKQILRAVRVNGRAKYLPYE